MLMIVGFHFVWVHQGSQWNITTYPFSFKKIIFEFLYGGGGWAGNFIFFVISVWFLADQKNTLRSSFRRIWIMEREILFWSVVLAITCVLLRRSGYYVGTRSSAEMLVRSTFPLITNFWWYPTSYAIFLLLIPFLNSGMKSLGARNHRSLAIICLVIWGILGLVPNMTFGLTTGVFVFIYWYILIAYYRWYMQSLNKKQSLTLLLSGIAIELVYLIGTNTFFAITHKMPLAQLFIINQWTLPTMMIGFALFTLVNRVTFHSKTINIIAASSFGIYLIHFDRYVFSFWEHYIPRNAIFESPYAILLGAAWILGLFAICLVLDLIRQLLFRVTIDRNRGGCFDRLYDWISRRKHKYHAFSSPRPGAIGDDSDLVD